MLLRYVILAGLLCGAATAQAAVHIECKGAKGGNCALSPPAPPPAPPAPPAPPVPHVSAPGEVAPPALPAVPALPAMPAMPAIPAPPPPPALPHVPAAAHAACAGKTAGSTVSLQPGPKESMSGVCEKAHGRMVFHLRSYHRED
ncbi:MULTISPECIES: hypothetical protein [unclassified Massilia]|uniref:hypothetical protein n=1 Tax=unclassified Massilia TaxID=2609279 RepID=UPI001602FAE5|nr:MULTISPECIES: hypothetical protein [unclassified Massilia]